MTALAVIESASIVAAELLLVCIWLWWWSRRVWRKHANDDEVGLAVFVEDPSVDEDINAPSLAVIEAALARTTDPEGRDYLLDRWNAAKRRVS